MALVVIDGTQYDEDRIPKHIDARSAVPVEVWFEKNRQPKRSGAEAAKVAKAAQAAEAEAAEAEAKAAEANVAAAEAAAATARGEDPPKSARGKS